MNTLQKLLIAGTIAAGITGAFATSLPVVVQAEETQTDPAVQKIITEYSDLWTGTITFQTGTPVQWYVHVPEDTEPKGCGATIKIPGLGWGTDTRSKEENHLTLRQGKNLVYEFTPQETGDFLFTCWMGSACHYNYIHVTEDGVPDSNAKTGGRGTAMPAETSTAQTTAVVQNNVNATGNTTTTTTAAASANNPVKPVSATNINDAKAVTVSAVQNVSTTAYANEYHEEVVVYAAAAVSDHTSNPKTGADSAALWLLLAGSLGTAFLTKKRK